MDWDEKGEARPWRDQPVHAVKSCAERGFDPSLGLFGGLALCRDLLVLLIASGLQQTVNTSICFIRKRSRRSLSC
jgi:hypothetical protein